MIQISIHTGCQTSVQRTPWMKRPSSSQHAMTSRMITSQILSSTILSLVHGHAGFGVGFQQIGCSSHRSRQIVGELKDSVNTTPFFLCVCPLSPSRVVLFWTHSHFFPLSSMHAISINPKYVFRNYIDYP